MNIPNRLSVLRILLVPVMTAVYLLEWAYAPLVAVVIFIIAASTDFLDGYIARKYNMVTDLGKLLDPIADKLLVLFSLFLLAYSTPFEPKWICAVIGAIIIGRELLISVVRQIAAAKGVVIQANIYGKIKTTVQCVSLPVCLLLKMKDVLVSLSQLFFDILYWIGYITLIVAALLTIISGIVYLIQNRKVFSD